MCWKGNCFSITCLSWGRFLWKISGNENKIPVATEVTKNRDIKLLYTVGQHKELLSTIWEYLELLSPRTWVGHFGKCKQKYGGKTHPYQRHVV